MGVKNGYITEENIMFKDCMEWRVLVNNKKQYSIWPLDKAIPSEWNVDGMVGTKESCLDYISNQWTDMKPSELTTFLQTGR